MQGEDLIHRLADDLRPVRPARPPGTATALWLGLATAVIIGAVLFLGLRHDLAERLASGFETPQLIPLLLGLGIRSFSMNASVIPRVKQAVRGLDIGDCARFARRVMEQSDPARIRELVAGFAAGAG